MDKETKVMSRSSDNFMRSLIKYRMVIIVLGMVIFLSLMSSAFFTSANIINLLRQISVNTILAMGMTFVIIAGGIDLSAGSIVAVSGCLAAGVIKPGLFPVWVAVAAGMLAGGTGGLITGTVVSRLKVAPFIITLAMMTIVRGIAYVYTNGRPIVDLPEGFRFIGQGSIGIVPIPVIVMAFVILISWILLEQTKFGRSVFYIGGNQEAARVSGIKVEKMLTVVYILNGLIGGLAGVVLAARIESGQPQAGVGYELDAIAAVVIGGGSLNGGVGTIFGTFAGAIIMGLINNGLNLLNVSAYWQMIAKGLVIFGAVLVDVQTNKRYDR